MHEKGFLERTGLTARDLVATKPTAKLVALDRANTVAHAAQVMSEHGFSQLPITAEGRIIGAINESHLYAELVKRPDIRTQPIETIMQPAFPFADISTGIDALARMLTPEHPAVLVRDFKSDQTYIITRSDVMRALS